MTARSKSVARDIGPRNAAKTKAAILAAGIKRFSDRSYGDVGLRTIADDAGIDVSLIARYFGSKEKLYVAVLAEVFDHAFLTAGDRSKFGSRTASMLLADTLEGVKGIESVLLVVRAASSPSSVSILRRLNHDLFIRPFAEWLGGTDAEIRAHFIASLISGMVAHRDVGAPVPLKANQKRRYIARLAAVLQDLVDDKQLPSRMRGTP